MEIETLIEPRQESTCSTLAIRPTKPTFFFDLDIADGYNIVQLRMFANTHLKLGYDIYKTKHGYHLVGKMPNWDECQRVLDLTKQIFPNVIYIRSCRRCYLRISEKFDNVTGEVVSPKPELYDCRCIGEHEEKRIGEHRIYQTTD
jgi:hypothetical protein